MECTVRHAAVAGRFYTDDEFELESEVDMMMAGLDRDPRIRGVIVPHAGYVYSGRTAAKAYGRLAMEKFRRVILLGPAHYHGFEGASLTPYDSYETPLGTMKVCTDLRDMLLDGSKLKSIASAHVQEHCLEVQLPFLQRLKPDLEILPIVCGFLELEQIRALAETLKPHWTADTLVVVSSDFTHYGESFGYRPFPENKAQESLELLDGEAIEQIKDVNAEGFAEYVDRTGATICGRHAITTFLLMLDSDAEVELLEYTTSGKLTGDFHSSVSYASLVAREPIYSSADKELMLSIARDAIHSRLTGQIVELPADIPEKMTEDGCCFVTLRIGGELRGCIGSLEPRDSLIRDIARNAVSAAFDDTRFPPLRDEEYDKLQYHISVLTPSRKIDSYKDIILGKHGITLHAMGKRSVFLPEVATEQGWDLQTTLEYLSRKAGLPTDAWKEATFTVFESISFGDD